MSFDNYSVTHHNSACNTANQALLQVFDSEIKNNKAVLSVVGRLRPLGLSALPVAPKQDPFKYPKKDKQGNIQYEADSVTPKPAFNGKNPSYLDADGVPHLINHSKYQNQQPTSKEHQIWFQNPLTGIGTLGNEQVTWIDIDSKNFESQEDCDQAFQKLLNEYPVLKQAWLEKTRSNGYRIGVKLASKKNFTNFKLSPDGQQVGEALGYGRFTVLAPTVGCGGSYQNLNYPDELPVIESLESIGVFPVSTKSDTEPQLNLDDTGKAECINPDTPLLLIDLITLNNKKILDGDVGDVKDKSDVFTKLLNDLYGWVNWCGKNNVNIINDAQELAFSTGYKLGFDKEKIDRVIKTIKTDVKPALHFVKSDKGCWDKVNKVLEFRKKAQSIKTVSPEQIKEAQDKMQYWADKLGLKLMFHPESGQPIGGWVPLVLQVAEKIGTRLKFNEMTQAFELDGKEIDLNTCQIILESECQITVGKERAVDLLAFVGKKLGSYHPIKEYLENVASKVRPNFDLLNNMATRYLGNDNQLANVYLRKTLIGAVARVLKPGSKMDTMTILYGEQGLFKSTFWAELVNVIADKNLFTDSLQDLSNKDELAKLRRFWCLELAEIDFLFSTKAKEQFKRFLSAQDDTYRPPYARANEIVLRTCFFAGTTNKKELLGDETGARRFWIIDCLQDIQIDLLKQERDILWATAYAAYMDGQQWWLTKEEQQASNAANEAYQDVDPWQSVILGYLSDLHQDNISTALIAQNALSIEVGRLDKKCSSRIAAIMRNLGWEYKNKKINGTQGKLWVKPKNYNAQPVQPVQPVQSVQPVEPVQPETQHQAVEHREAQPQPEDIAEMPVQNIVDVVSNLDDSAESIHFIGTIFYLMGVPKQNQMQRDFEETFNHMNNCFSKMYPDF